VRPQAARELLDPTFRWLKLDELARSFRAARAFWEAAGPRIRPRARAERLRGSTLHVRVATSAWSQHLHALKAQLLERIRQRPGGELVEDLRFSVAPLEEVAAWDADPVAAPVEAVPPVHPPIGDEIVRAMAEVKDDELREELTRLFSRLGTRPRL
jgi:predicted nucleic acid-binding Zn ribbon protein